LCFSIRPFALTRSLITPQFAVSFDAPVWSIQLDHASGLLVAEIRDGDARRVSFAALDLDQPGGGALLWKDFQPDDWSVRQMGVLDGVLLLQGFGTGQPPSPTHLVAVDVRERRVRWRRPGWALMEARGSQVKVYPTEAPLESKIWNVRSGQAEGEMAIYEENAASPPADVQYPTHYPEDSPYFSAVARFLEQRLGVQPVRAFDYAETQGLVVVSYYLCAAGALENRLVVFGPDAQVWWHEPVASQLSGVGLDTFLIRKNCLILVREKKELRGYALG
jgi:hypothetical protein